MNNIKTFPAPASGRQVALNVSFDHVELLRHLSKEQLLEAIDRHERARCEDLWAYFEQPSEKGPWIWALDSKLDVKRRHIAQHFSAAGMRALADSEEQGPELLQALRSLSVEEQRQALRRHLPKSREELKRLVYTLNTFFAPDFRSMLEEAPTPLSFINGMVEQLVANTTAPYHADRYVELLVVLWEQGYLLYPLGMRQWVNRVKWIAMLNPRFAGQRALTMQAAVSALKAKDDRPVVTMMYQAFASSAMATVDDLSLELIAAYEDEQRRLCEDTSRPDAVKEAAWSISVVLRATQALRILFNSANPSLAVSVHRKKQSAHPAGARRGDGKFAWLREEYPEMVEWADALSAYCGQLKTARLSGKVTRLNRLIDFVISLEDPPRSPLEVSRPVHIYDATLRNANTYYECLRKGLPDPDAARTAFSDARAFFDWYADFLVASRHPQADTFKNPILSTDSFGRSNRDGSQTGRTALPGFVLNELKDVLLADDFAFGKQFSQAYVRVADPSTKAVTQVWFPAYTVCLYLMLEVPVRSHQARWLDSGELDDLVYDHHARRYVPNQAAGAIPGRNEAVLRVQHDALRAADWLGLWVNTNKTASIDSKTFGYLVPYVSDKLAELLRMMQNWQRKYTTPLAAPIPYYGDKHNTAERQRIADAGPQVVPLFRNPEGYAQDAPISYNMLANFYVKALAEAQRRIEEKYGHAIQLVTTDAKGDLTWTVDMHSLRVSGITQMIENGVPLEVVSQFVAGHATLVMTLHYLKYSPLKIREILSTAHENALADTDFVGSGLFTDNLDTFSKFLLGQEGAGTGPGLSALQEKTGIITITSEGICPGTSCATGGPVDSTKVKHGPVPGGRRCGMCRYWLTGPAFLLGQVAAVNNLAYAIRKKGLEVASLNDARLDAEDAGDQRKARELRDRVDVLNKELGLDIEEWASRYRYASQSVTLMDSYLKAKASVTNAALPVPLLTAGTSEELKVTLEEAHEFALLDQITQLSEFVTGFPNREAELEKHNILSRMMAANGMKPFLLTLTPEQAHEAGNLLSSVLLQQVRAQELDDVLSGKKPLAHYPQLEKAVHLLESDAAKGSVGRKVWSIASLPITEPAKELEPDESFE